MIQRSPTSLRNFEYFLSSPQQTQSRSSNLSCLRSWSSCTNNPSNCYRRKDRKRIPPHGMCLQDFDREGVRGNSWESAGYGARRGSGIGTALRITLPFKLKPRLEGSNEDNPKSAIFTVLSCSSTFSGFKSRCIML